MSFEVFKRFISEIRLRQGRDTKEPLHPLERLAAGGAAGVAAAVLCYPLEVAKTLLTTHPETYKGIFSTLTTLVRQQGFQVTKNPSDSLPLAWQMTRFRRARISLSLPNFLFFSLLFSSFFPPPPPPPLFQFTVVLHTQSLYRGLGPTMFAMFPYVGLEFMIYEQMKMRYERWSNVEDPHIVVLLTIGALAGATSLTVCHPLDVVRKRMQLQGVAGRPVQYRHFFDAISSIAKTEGAPALYRGKIQYTALSSHEHSLHCA